MGWAVKCGVLIVICGIAGGGCSIGAAALGVAAAMGPNAQRKAAAGLDKMWGEPDDRKFVDLAFGATQTRSLLLWGPRGQVMGRRLLLLTRHEDHDLAAEGAYLLPAYGVTAVEAVPAIVGMTARLARAESDAIRGWGGMGVGFTVASYFPASVPVLWAMSLHPDPYVRQASVAFLALPWHKSVLNVPPLTLALLDWSPRNRRQAARVLGIHQWWALPAVPALAGSRAWDGDEDVRKEAAYSIRRITTPRL